MFKLGKKKIIIIAIITFVVFVALFVVWFVYGLKEDQANTRKVMTQVEDLYDEFGDSIDTFNDIRNNLYLNVFDNIYYDTLVENDESIKKLFLEYENSVNTVSDKTGDLKKLCDMAYYPDKNINLKCDQFESVYEQVVNAFKSDIDLYNLSIEEYNSSNGDMDVILEKVKTNIDYIDYDKDGNYDGKEENE